MLNGTYVERAPGTGRIKFGTESNAGLGFKDDFRNWMNLPCSCWFQTRRSDRAGWVVHIKE